MTTFLNKFGRPSKAIKTNRFNILCIVILTLFTSNEIYCQFQTSAYYNIKRDNILIEYLLNSGKISLDHPLSQPYDAHTLQIVLDNMNDKKNLYWIEYIQHNLKDFIATGHSKDRGNIFLGSRGILAPEMRNNIISLRERFELWGKYLSPQLVLIGKLVTDQYFKEDPYYFGYDSEAYYGRMEDAYALSKYNSLSLFYGRIQRNLGFPNEKSLFLSDNAYSYDHCLIEYADNLLKYSFLFTRLEDIYGFDIRYPDQLPSWYKRYLSVHRVELNIFDNLKIGLSESVIYGGKSQKYIYAYLNPVVPFYLSKYNERTSNEENIANVNSAFEIYWKPSQKITWFSQLMVDDVDFKESNRKKYPERLGLFLKIISADLPFSGLQCYINYLRIDNWTYNSFYTWGNYIYHSKSLGYPKNRVESFKIGADYFGYSPFIFRTSVLYENSGVQQLDSAFVAKKTEFPLGIDQNAFSIEFITNYLPVRFIDTELSLRWTKYNNYKYIHKKHKSSFEFSVSAEYYFDWLLL